MIELKVPDLIKETSINTGANSQSVKAVLELTEEGCTIPFIARYRKERTGNLDEVQIAQIIDVSQKIEALDKRKRAVLKSLVETENYTDELGKMVDNAADMAILEDIYAPYKPGRKTKADKAISAGLLPLADWIIKRKRTLDEIRAKAVPFICESFNTVEEVVQGATEIIAQKFADDMNTRSVVRTSLRRGILSSKVKRGKKEDGSLYSDYFDYSEPVSKVAPHRVMAVLRGEHEGFLNVSVSPSKNAEELAEAAMPLFFREKSDFYKDCAKYSIEKLLLNSLETEVISELRDKAVEASLEYFHKNLEQILNAPPFGEKCVIGVDPGIRTGCKAALLDSYGNFIDSTVMNLHSDRSEALKIKNWVEKYEVKGIAVGSGTFGRESLEILRSYYAKSTAVVSVSEDGASIYSASETAREEFPELDITVRGAISIGRRFQDPLSELVKIAPESLGIGQYQHDMPAKMLAEKLQRTVEWVVNRVGANINTASQYLLNYISGLDRKRSAEIVNARKLNGRFNRIEELKKVKGIGPKSFEQCAGFLRILDGAEILDSTGVHPESYPLVKKAAEVCNVSVEELVKAPSILEKNSVASQIVTPSIIEELKKRGMDPRDKFETAEFSESIRMITDLKTGMMLNGVVDNITAFGAFIDIGIKEKGLLHISEICNEFIKSPSEKLKLGQVVKVTVKQIDLERKRISLTMKG